MPWSLVVERVLLCLAHRRASVLCSGGYYLFQGKFLTSVFRHGCWRKKNPAWRPFGPRRSGGWWSLFVHISFPFHSLLLFLPYLSPLWAGAPSPDPLLVSPQTALCEEQWGPGPQRCLLRHLRQGTHSQCQHLLGPLCLWAYCCTFTFSPKLKVLLQWE